jgi:p-cumate 2,3-dioxygenase beta subunit
MESDDGGGVMAPKTSDITRSQVEDFLYREAALLDEWKLEEWLTLLTDDAAYYVPPNDHPDGDHRTVLFILADDIVRIRERVIRLMSPECHAEYPHSRTRRLISNVRIVGVDGDLVTVAANFVCSRFRRYERVREYVGAYRFILKRVGEELRIKERRVIIDAHELGSLGAVSFIL